MAHRFDPSRKYMMPVSFGPMAGPRQTPAGRRYIDGSPTERTRLLLQFLSNSERLAALLPEGLKLADPPVVTLDLCMLKNISWLAGRGYNVFGVRIPVRFDGKRDHVQGPFVLVLWESLADPILTGREQLGYPKLYAEIPDPVINGDTATCEASWLGFQFFEMTLKTQEKLSAEETADYRNALQRSDGTIAHKYLPHTGEPWNEADADYFTMTPIPSEAQRLADPPLPLPQIWRSTGTFAFHEAAWEDLPTQFHIVNALARLPVLEVRQALLVREQDNTDFHDQKALV